MNKKKQVSKNLHFLVDIAHFWARWAVHYQTTYFCPFS